MEQTVSNDELKKILQDVGFNAQEPVDTALTRPMTDEQLRAWSADQPTRGEVRKSPQNSQERGPVNAVVNHQLADLPILDWTVRILKLVVAVWLVGFLLALPAALFYMMIFGYHAGVRATP